MWRKLHLVAWILIVHYFARPIEPTFQISQAVPRAAAAEMYRAATCILTQALNAAGSIGVNVRLPLPHPNQQQTVTDNLAWDFQMSLIKCGLCMAQ